VLRKVLAAKATLLDCSFLFVLFSLLTSRVSLTAASFFSPEISFERVFRKSEKLDAQIAFEIDTSISIISDHLADYFFSVQPEFATADRAEFDARPGLLAISSGLILKVSQRRGSNIGSTFFVGLRHNHHGLSANQSSPLHKADQTVTLFTGVNVYWLSSERSGAED
jgi:hypothetical protein